MVKKNKKFWSGIFLTTVGVTILIISYICFKFFENQSWIGTMAGEIGGIGLPILVIGITLILFNKNIKTIV